MYEIGIKYKIQAIRTSDVAICYEKWRQTGVHALSEVNIFRTRCRPSKERRCIPDVDI